MTSSANVVTGFEFPHAEIPRGPRETLTAETSLPVTIFASPRNFKSPKQSSAELFPPDRALYVSVNAAVHDPGGSRSKSRNACPAR